MRSVLEIALLKTTNQILVLLLVVVTFSSCHKREGYVYATSCTYFIDINFRDSLGNDLVASLAEGQEGRIDPELYRLDILSQDGEIIEHDRRSGPTIRPFFTINEFDVRYQLNNNLKKGRNYLEQQLIVPAETYVLQQKLTYIIICPSIFGDNLSHEVITYWDFSKEDITPPLKKEKFPECYGVIYEDQILVPDKKFIGASGPHYSYFVDIVLGIS